MNGSFDDKFQVELERGEAATDRSLECSWVDTSLRDRVEEFPSLSSWDGDQVKTFVLLFVVYLWLRQ